MPRALVLVLLLATAPASAHHVISEYGAAPIAPVSVAELDAQAARFRLGGRTGGWQAALVGVEVAVRPWLSISGRAGVAHVSFDDAPGDGGTGVTDADVGAKLRLHAGHRLTLVGGLAVGLPTGGEAAQIGAGHVELNPFVGASLQVGDALLLNLSVADRLALGGHDDGYSHAPGEEDFHGSVVAPHGDHELVTRLTAALVAAPLLIGVGLEHTQVFAGDPDGALLTARAEVGVDLAGSTRLLVGGDAPLAGEQRFSWRARAAVARRF